jgi:hypothetical protein
MSNIAITASELFAFVVDNEEVLFPYEKDGIIFRQSLPPLILPEELISATLNRIQNQLGVLIDEDEPEVNPILYARDRNYIHYHIYYASNIRSYIKVYFLRDESEVVVILLQASDTTARFAAYSKEVSKLIDILQYSLTYSDRNLVKVFNPNSEDLYVYEDSEEYIRTDFVHDVEEVDEEVDVGFVGDVEDELDDELPEWYTEPAAEMKFEDIHVPALSDSLERLSLQFPIALNVDGDTPPAPRGFRSKPFPMEVRNPPPYFYESDDEVDDLEDGEIVDEEILTRQHCQSRYPSDPIDRYYAGGDRLTNEELEKITQKVQQGTYSATKLKFYLGTIPPPGLMRYTTGHGDFHPSVRDFRTPINYPKSVKVVAPVVAPIVMPSLPERTIEYGENFIVDEEEEPARKIQRKE